MPDVTPLFTKRDPATGAVLFDFSGHIHAQGLDLDAGGAQENKVTWTQTSDGSNVGDIWASPNPRTLSLRSYASGAIPSASISIQAQNAPGVGATGIAYVAPSVNPGAAAGNRYRIDVGAANSAANAIINRTLLDDVGASDFMLFTAYQGSLINGWANYGFGTDAFGYMIVKDTLGRATITFRGVINSGALGAACTTLPVGARPGGQRIISTIGSAGLGRVDVMSTGAVVPQAGIASSGGGSGNWLSLDGISFTV